MANKYYSAVASAAKKIGAPKNSATSSIGTALGGAATSPTASSPGTLVESGSLSGGFKDIVGTTPILMEVDPYYKAEGERLNDYYNNVINLLGSQESAARANAENEKTATSEAMEKANQSAYIDKELSAYQVGDKLSAMGYSGGTAESTLAKIHNAYQNNKRENEQSRAKALRDIESGLSTNLNDIASQRTSYTSDWQKAINDNEQARMNRISELEEEKAAKYEAEKAAAEAQAAATAKAKIAAANDKMKAKELVAKASGKTTKGYTDSTGLYHYSVVNNSKKASGTSGSGNASTANVKKVSGNQPTAKQKSVYNSLLNGLASAANRNSGEAFIVNTIKKNANSGAITEKQAKSLLNRYVT